MHAVLVVNGGGGNDRISILASTSDVSFAEINGDAGDDILTDADTGDALSGGDGNDRLVGGNGGDDMTGGAGDDTFVWSDGDGSDSVDGESGEDTVEVNGSPTLGDSFTLAPDRGVILFRRRNLTTFTLRTSAEHFQVNALGGDDSVTASPGVGALTQLSVDGGSGADALTGSDGSDLLVGGSGNDRIAAGLGRDAVFGGAGDDQVDVRDDDRDFASGGDGADVVFADAADADLIDGFETVDRPAPVVVDPPPAPVEPPPAPVDPPPAPATPPATTQPPPSAPEVTGVAVRIQAGTAKVSGGRAALRISCRARSARNCTGVLELRTTKGLKLGRARYDAASGASVTVKVKLPRGIRRLVEKRQLTVVAVASANGLPQSSRRVTLALARGRTVRSGAAR